VHAPFKSLLPMVEPNAIVLGGWDISGLNMAEAMERAQVGARAAEGWAEHAATRAGGRVLPGGGISAALCVVRIANLRVRLMAVAALFLKPLRLLPPGLALPPQVLDFELQKQLVPYMKDMVPLPGEGG
jgi:hypothetical protein